VKVKLEVIQIHEESEFVAQIMEILHKFGAEGTYENISETSGVFRDIVTSRTAENYYLEMDAYYNKDIGWSVGEVHAWEDIGDDVRDAGLLSVYFGDLEDIENTLKQAIYELTA